MPMTLASAIDCDATATTAAPDRAENRLARGPGRLERNLEICEGMIDIAAALFNISSKDLRKAGRTTLGISRVRQIAMYVAHVALGLSMGDVGCGFARDRTTVLHACHLVEDMRDDEDFDRIVATTERIAVAAFGAPGRI